MLKKLSQNYYQRKITVSQNIQKITNKGMRPVREKQTSMYK